GRPHFNTKRTESGLFATRCTQYPCRVFRMRAIIHEYQSTSSPNGSKHAAGTMPKSYQEFPYLEKIDMVAQKNPYAMLGAMIGIAAIVITAVNTFAIAIFTAAFLLYGTVSEMNVTQKTMLDKMTEGE